MTNKDQEVICPPMHEWFKRGKTKRNIMTKNKRKPRYTPIPRTKQTVNGRNNFLSNCRAGNLNMRES